MIIDRDMGLYTELEAAISARMMTGASIDDLCIIKLVAAWYNRYTELIAWSSKSLKEKAVHLSGMLRILQDREDGRKRIALLSSRVKAVELHVNSEYSNEPVSIPQETLKSDKSDIEAPLTAPVILALEGRRPSRDNQFSNVSDRKLVNVKSIASPKIVPLAAPASSDLADQLFAIAFDTETHDFSTRAGHSLQGRVIQVWFLSNVSLAGSNIPDLVILKVCFVSKPRLFPPHKPEDWS
jgi:hypothetical protein